MTAITVKITATVTIDAEEWAMNYGVQGDNRRNKAIRADILAFGEDLIRQSMPCQVEDA